MTLDEIKKKIYDFLTKIEEQGVSKGDFYYIDHLSGLLHKFANEHGFEHWLCDREFMDIVNSLEELKWKIFRTGVVHKYNEDNVNYILEHSKILPLVLANNTHNLISMYADDSYRFLCHFHNEQHPSLGVVDGDNYYKCFGCGTSGGVIKYLQNSEGLKFTEIVELLSQAFMISEDINNPKLNELVAKYRKAILSDEYYYLLVQGKNRAIDRISVRDWYYDPFVMWNPYKEEYQTNKDVEYDRKVEQIEKRYQERFDNIERIRYGVYDPNFKLGKVRSRVKFED